MGNDVKSEGYKYTPPTHGLGKRGVFKFNLNSLSNGGEQARASDVNPTVRDSRNNSLNSWKLKQSPLRHATRKPKGHLHLERKDLPRRMHDIMVKTLKTLNDAHSINHATIAQKYKFKFE